MPVIVLLVLLLAAPPAAAKGWSVYEQIVPSGLSTEFVDVEFDSRERNSLIIKASGYRLKVDLVGPKVSQFVGGGRSANFLLAPAALQAEVDGRDLSSGSSGSKARQSIRRYGPYFHEVRIFDFPLCSPDGQEGPATGELAFYCYPEKFHLQATVTARDGARVSEARMVFRMLGRLTPTVPDSEGTSRTVFTSTRGNAGVVFGAGTSPVVEGGADRSALGLTRKLPVGVDQAVINLAWLSSSSVDEAEKAGILECRPLQPGNITISGDGGFEGYDRVRGHYVLRTSWSPPPGVEPNRANPNRYLGVSFKIAGDEHARRFYFRNYSFSAGAIEAGVLTDPFGFPIPIPVQVCRGSGDGGEEPDDTSFSETYFPVQIAPRQVVELNSLHIFQNWGSRTLRGPDRSRWPDQPQYDRTGMIGFLQYHEAQKWRQLRYLGTSFQFSSPCFANFTLNYLSDDGKVRAVVEVFEVPQTDETRSFVKIRYEVLENVKIDGDARHNLRFLSAGADRARNGYSTVAFLGRENKPVVVDLRYDDTHTIEGAGLGSEHPFVCLYGGDGGNSAFIIRRFEGMVGGKRLEELAASTIGYEDGVVDQFLTTTERRVELEPGDYLEAEIILLPCATAASDWRQPNRERFYYGLQSPKVDVERGLKVSDFPTVVESVRGIARFSVSGGHDLLPLIVSGMPRYKAPMLWQNWGPEGPDAKKRLASELAAGWDFLDHQVVGNDWYQVRGDGPYDFAFLVGVRAGQQNRYMVTQATSDAEIKSVRVRAGQVIVEAERPDRMEILSPRLFVGLKNRLEAENPVITSSGRAISAATAPFFAGMANGRADISDIAIAGDRLKFHVEGSGRLSLTFPGLQPGGSYLLTRSKERWDLKADAQGRVNIEIPIGGQSDIGFSPAR